MATTPGEQESPLAGAGEPGSPPPSAGPPLLLDPNLTVIYGITLLPILAVSTIAPVFPTVAREMGVAPEAVSLLITAFTLPGIVLAPLLGILADRFGRKQVLVPAVVLFSLAGAACALARDFQTLLLLRFLQGVGGASLGSLSATLIGDLFRGHRQVSAMGYNAAMLSVGSAIFPSLGGGLALLAWHLPFALPILGLVVALAVLFRMEVVEIHRGSSLRSYLGEAWEGMRAGPVLGLYLSSLATFVVLYGAYTVFIPLHLSAAFGSSALGIGLIMTVGSAATAITATTLGGLSRRFTRPRLVITAFALYALSFVLIPWLPAYGWVALPVALIGVAQGLNYPVVLSMLALSARPEHRAVFLSANGMVLRIGQTLGPVLMAGIAAWGGMEPVFYAAAAICLGMYLLLPALLRPRDAAREKGGRQAPGR